MATLARRKPRKGEKQPARSSRRPRQPADQSSHFAVAKALAKTADSKGRVSLGGQFANRAVLIEQLNDTEVLVKMARVIPESEAWLFENPVALAAVRNGLAQARAGETNEGPDLASDEALIAQLED
jgi:hypothetical protein